MGDLKRNNLDYFIMKDPKFARFYLLPQIHERLHNVQGRPVVATMLRIFPDFLDHHLQPLAEVVKSYIKDANEFLKKLRFLPKFPDRIILCTMDVVGLYSNIPHEEGLSALRKRLESLKEKYFSTDTIIDLAEVVLTLFRMGGCKMAPPPTPTSFSPVTSTNVGIGP